MSNTESSSTESSSSESEASGNSCSDFDIEEEDGAQRQEEEQSDEQHGAFGIVPYQYEPIASPEWLQEYNKRRQEDAELLEKQKGRLEGRDVVENWCKCRRCSTELVQNPRECLCCQEIPECVEVLMSDDVLLDPAVSGQPECITLHPGFSPICLERWSLKQAAAKLRTRERKEYQQTGSEAEFLRSISYREYVILVYGRSGWLRQPLPACAYNAIRKQFSTNTA